MQQRGVVGSPNPLGSPNQVIGVEGEIDATDERADGEAEKAYQPWADECESGAVPAQPFSDGGGLCLYRWGHMFDRLS